MQDIDQLGRLAQAGMIRAFVLLAGGSPCAFIIGYLYRGVFHYADLAYRESHAAHSPGTVLLYLAIKELIEQDHPQYINFGVTDNQFKQVFADQHTEDAEVLILRPGTASWLLRTAHSSFQKAKHRVRARLVRPNPAKQPDAAP
jgi:CelD/BcsL family acetyltransferase involved in cellulose biosynthesis